MEEHITVENGYDLSSYSFSNSLGDIKIAVFLRTGLEIDFDNICWQLNPELSMDVKDLMDKHNANYSMTTWGDDEEKGRHIDVNMRVGDEWFLTEFFESGGAIHNFQKLKIYREVFKRLEAFSPPYSSSVVNSVFSENIIREVL